MKCIISFLNRLLLKWTIPMRSTQKNFTKYTFLETIFCQKMGLRGFDVKDEWNSIKHMWTHLILHYK